MGFRGTVVNDEPIRALHSTMDRLSDNLQNQVIRAGVQAAGEPIRATFTQLASRYRGKDPPTRTLRGTNIKVSRPHMNESIITKLWKIPDGTGYFIFVGPVSIEVPHAKWFGDKAPTNRYTKTGKFRGTHLSGKGPRAVGGGPAHLLTRTVSQSMSAAVSAAAQAMEQKINSLKLD